MKNTKEAFVWITDIIEKLGIRYKISGGLAARIYGSNRELDDIDIEVEDEDINKIKEEVEAYVIFGPTNFIDENWDTKLMTLSYKDQKIDISGINAKIFNQQTKQWEDLSSNLEDVKIMEVYDKKVPVCSMESLVAYKTKLGREVDLEDIRQLNDLKTKY
jgi:hypothetical protein